MKEDRPMDRGTEGTEQYSLVQEQIRYNRERERGFRSSAISFGLIDRSCANEISKV